MVQNKPQILIARKNFVFEDRQFFENDEVDIPLDKASGLIRKGMVSQIEVIEGMQKSPVTGECKKKESIEESLIKSEDFEHQSDGDFIKAVIESIKLEKPSSKAKNPRPVKKVEIDLADTDLIDQADKISKPAKLARRGRKPKGGE